MAILRARAFANLGYALLFPGFYFVYFGAAAGLWGVKAYFGIVAISVIFLFSLFYPLTVVRRMAASPGIVILLSLLMTWCAVWTIINWYIDPELPDAAFAQIWTAILFWYALFLIGMFIDLSGALFRKVMFFSFFGMLAIALFYVDPSTMVMNPASIFSAEDLPTYQGFSRSAMMTCAVVVSLIISPMRRRIMIAISILLLFILGARSELFGFIAAVAVVEAIEVLKNPRQIAVLSIATVLVAGLVARNWEELQTSRQLQIFDLANASSWILRQEFTMFAFYQIVDHPISGVFAGHFDVDWPYSSGSYSHNVLSAWVSFGLLGFILYLSLMFVVAWKGFASARKQDALPIERLSAYINISSFLLILIAKDVFWPLVALGWGLAVNVKSRD